MVSAGRGSGNFPEYQKLKSEREIGGAEVSQAAQEPGKPHSHSSLRKAGRLNPLPCFRKRELQKLMVAAVGPSHGPPSCQGLYEIEMRISRKRE